MCSRDDVYEESIGINFIERLNGIFAFALYDIKNNEYLIARDHIGIIPLYMGWDEKGTFYIASELKALEGYCNNIKIFPPGHYYFSKEGQLNQWYDRKWDHITLIDDEKEIAIKRYETYEKSTEPVIEYYKKLKLLKVIDGERSIDQINKEISDIIALI